MNPADEEKVERDALCPDCGQGFKVYLSRIMPENRSSRPETELECPHCGCRECRLQDSVR